MSNKKIYLKRKLKLPNRFNDHVMSNLSQKHHYSSGDAESEEIRVDNDDRGEEIGETNDLEEVGDDGEGLNKGVFGSDLNVQNADNQANKTSDVSRRMQVSYASRLSGGLNANDNELFYVPTVLNENGAKKVVFKEEMVREGNADGLCYFKFKTEEVMNQIIDQSSWLVNGKPLIVQKWDPDTIITKESPCKIPIWIRLLNIPLEAWSTKGISAISNRLGRPIKIDQMTVDMCKAGSGRLGYARVLVEINAEDNFLNKIKISYVDDMMKVKRTKWVKVEYTWRPQSCNHCRVFGHSVHNCKLKPKTTIDNCIKSNEGFRSDGAYKEGFVEVRHRKQFVNNRRMGNNDPQGSKQAVSGIKFSFVLKNIKTNNVNDKQKEKKEKESSNEEEVFMNDNQADNCIVTDEIEGNVYGGVKEQGSCRQFILCLVELIQSKVRVFVSFVYADNSCTDRRSLWTNLHMHKSLVGQQAWVLMGDFNVTFKSEEHSNGTSSMNVDMEEFKDIVNSLEVEDMVFNSHGLSPSKILIVFPKSLIEKKKSFRFVNYVADKEEFSNIVRENGNLFDQAKDLKEKLKVAQSEVDVDPFNKDKKKNDVILFNEYSEVAEDELKLLHQKAKVQWLKEVNPLRSLGDIVQLKLIKVEAIGMIHDVSDKEIKDALFDIDSSKATGPYGYTLCFFKKAWHIIRNGICLSEILKDYNRKNGAKRCVVKINIQKAYDTINWDFIEEVMLLNIKKSNQFRYHIRCKDLKLTHMCFANDLMVLYNGDVDSLKVVKNSLDDFSGVYGLHSNLSKSTIFFGSINERDKGDLLQIINFKCGKLPRKIQLIASVLSTMQQYSALVYSLPLTVIKELNKLFKRFLWNFGNFAKGKARVAWNIVCRPKDQGRLGFKPLRKWNEVLLVSRL
nr:hypothetical protein [Tanacetum cinerariifolium]